MLGIGIIGCGGIARKRHAPEYSANPAAELIGFYDVRRESAEELAAQYGGRAYAGLEELLQDERIGAVSVCTINSLHAEIAVAALKSGKHVLVEKPMAESREDIARMLDAAKSSGKRLLVGHNQRLMPAHRIGREIVESGALGRVLGFETRFCHSGPETFASAGGAWYYRRGIRTGSLTDLGIHKFDLMRYLTGAEYAEITTAAAARDKTYADGAPIETDDVSVSLVRMADGCIGSIRSGWIRYGAIDNSTVLEMQKAVIRLLCDPEYPVIIERMGQAPEYPDCPAVSISGVMDEFVDAVRTGRPSPLDAENIAPSMLALLAAEESAEKGTTVSL